MLFIAVPVLETLHLAEQKLGFILPPLGKGGESCDSQMLSWFPFSVKIRSK